MKPGRGFTLVEVMVALAVVAIALPALLLALSQQVDATAYLRDKSLARMVAANKLVELRILSRASQGLPSGERSGVTTMAGREWYWWLNSKPTVSDNLLQFEIDVAATEAPEEAPLFTLLAYLSSDFQGASGDDSASP